MVLYLFNEAERRPIATIYGCATGGIEWRLHQQLYAIDTKTYIAIPEILGAWHKIIGQDVR